MSSFRVRPKFKISSSKTLDELVTSINQHLETTEYPIEGKVFKTHGLLKINEKEQHYWSPQLQISFDDTEEASHTIIRGMYGPHPSVWSVFLMGYILSGIGIFFAALVGFARLSLGLSYGVLWVVPVLLVVIIILWLMAQFGQKVGAEQTFMIHHFFEESIHQQFHLH